MLIFGALGSANQKAALETRHQRACCDVEMRALTSGSSLDALTTRQPCVIIGINHGFQCSNIRWIKRKVFEHKAAGRVFKHLPSDPENI